MHTCINTYTYLHVYIYTYIYTHTPTHIHNTYCIRKIIRMPQLFRGACFVATVFLPVGHGPYYEREFIHKNRI